MGFNISINNYFGDVFKNIGEWIKRYFAPLGRDKSLYYHLTEELNKNDFIDKTRQHEWAGKFVWNDLLPFFRLLDDKDRKEFRFIDRKMENKRQVLFVHLHKLYCQVSANFTDVGFNPSLKITFYGPHKNFSKDDSTGEKIAKLLNEVQEICDQIYAAYEDFHDTGIKKFGERVG